MNKKTFFFDCFGVLSERVLGNWVPQGMGPDFDPTDLFRKLDLGEISEYESLLFFSEKVGRSPEEIRIEIDSHFKPNTELLEFIKQLKSKGHKIVLLSNATYDFFERYIASQYPTFLDSFDDVIISSQIKMIKPNSDIYEYALNKNSVQPGDVIFIDDNKDNIEGAQNIGLESILFTTNEQLKKDLADRGITI